MELRNVCTVFLVGGFLRDHVIVAIFGRHISKMEVMASTIAQLCCLLKIAFLHQEIYPRNTNFTHNRVFIGNFLTSQCWVRIIVSPFFPLSFSFTLMASRYLYFHGAPSFLVELSCTNSFIYLQGKFLSRKQIGPRKSENLTHLFGKRSWKEISERNRPKKESKSNTCIWQEKKSRKEILATDLQQ